MTQLERLFAVADCANGIGSKLDITKWTFLNTDLAVHVFRIPDGDWIGIRAETNYGPDGIGTTVGTLFDEQGAVGAIQQSVLVRRRPGANEKVSQACLRLRAMTETDTSTRQRILAATAEVLGRNGKTKLSLSEVATQAGVSRPTLYRWFASKEELLSAFSQLRAPGLRKRLGQGNRGAEGRRQARRRAAVHRRVPAFVLGCAHG